MIALGNEELLPSSVTLLLSFPRSIEDGWDGKHRDDGEDLGSALVVDGGEEHLGERGFHRVVGHLPSEGSEISNVVESSENPELVHRVDDVFLRNAKRIRVSSSSCSREEMEELLT